MEQKIAGECDDLDDYRVMGVGKPLKVYPMHQQIRERKTTGFLTVKNILDFDDTGADMIEVSGMKFTGSRDEANDEEDKNERQSSISGG